MIGVQTVQALKGVVQNGEGLGVGGSPLDQGTDLVAIVVHQGIPGGAAGLVPAAAGGLRASR